MSLRRFFVVLQLTITKVKPKEQDVSRAMQMMLRKLSDMQAANNTARGSLEGREDTAPGMHFCVVCAAQVRCNCFSSLS